MINLCQVRKLSSACDKGSSSRRSRSLNYLRSTNRSVQTDWNPCDWINMLSSDRVTRMTSQWINRTSDDSIKWSRGDCWSNNSSSGSHRSSTYSGSNDWTSSSYWMDNNWINWVLNSRNWIVRLWQGGQIQTMTRC